MGSPIPALGGGTGTSHLRNSVHPRGVCVDHRRRGHCTRLTSCYMYCRHRANTLILASSDARCPAAPRRAKAEAQVKENPRFRVQLESMHRKAEESVKTEEDLLELDNTLWQHHKLLARKYTKVNPRRTQPSNLKNASKSNKKTASCRRNTITPNTSMDSWNTVTSSGVRIVTRYRESGLGCRRSMNISDRSIISYNRRITGSSKRTPGSVTSRLTPVRSSVTSVNNSVGNTTIIIFVNPGQAIILTTIPQYEPT